MSIARDLLIGITATTLLAALALRTLPDAQAPVAVSIPVPAPVPAAVPDPVPRVAMPARTSVPAAPLHTRNGRAIDLQGQDVAAYIARRGAAARTGDARAAYEIYQAASLCAAAEPALPDFRMPAERHEADAERQRVRALCAGVSPAQMQERMAFLARAAQAGSRDARIDFFMEGPQGQPPDAEAQAGDPQVAEWQRQAFGYLAQAGAQCDAFALALLSNAYDLGKLVPYDAGLTMQYAMAAAAARGAAMTEAALRERFGPTMGAGEFAAALQAGYGLARQVCPAQR